MKGKRNKENINKTEMRGLRGVAGWGREEKT